MIQWPTMNYTRTSSILIDTYVQHQTVKVDLLSLVARSDVPVKGILADLEPLLLGAISPADAKIIKDIAFHFA
jgi:hypothetical protein